MHLFKKNQKRNKPPNLPTPATKNPHPQNKELVDAVKAIKLKIRELV